jgi:periplasmic protein TonB
MINHQKTNAVKTKKQIIRLANIKLLLILPVITTILVLFSSCSDNKNNEDALAEIAPPPPPPPVPSIDEIYTDVDEMPVFEGGDTALLSFVAKKTVYPSEAKLNGIQGRILVKFVVEKDGTVSNAEIIEGADPLLDEEALKVVKSLPAFAKPGKIGGKNVRVVFMLPISFVLKAF